jgi:hypothetical protein
MLIVRLPEHRTIEEALDYCERRGLKNPMLHAGPLGEIRGEAEKEETDVAAR